MRQRRKIEVFSAGCSLCTDAWSIVRRIAGEDDEVAIVDMQSSEGRRKALQYGVDRVPAIFIDGHASDCCETVVGDGVSEDALRRQGVGSPVDQ